MIQMMLLLQDPGFLPKLNSPYRLWLLFKVIKQYILSGKGFWSRVACKRNLGAVVLTHIFWNSEGFVTTMDPNIQNQRRVLEKPGHVIPSKWTQSFLGNIGQNPSFLIAVDLFPSPSSPLITSDSHPSPSRQPKWLLPADSLKQGSHPVTLLLYLPTLGLSLIHILWVRQGFQIMLVSVSHEVTCIMGKTSLFQDLPISSFQFHCPSSFNTSLQVPPSCLLKSTRRHLFQRVLLPRWLLLPGLAIPFQVLTSTYRLF